MSVTALPLTVTKRQNIIEAALMVSPQPLTIAAMQNLFHESERPSTSEIRAMLSAIATRHFESGIELKEVAGGFRLQISAEFSPWLRALWEDRPPRYSRAFLETLSIIAYKQPITRGEIEAIRGVTVSSNIIKTLFERDWIRIIGHKEVPGRPAIYGTTKEFLDYFNLKSLTDLPPLAEFQSFEIQDTRLQVQLALDNSKLGPVDSENITIEKTAQIEAEEESFNE